MTDRRRSCRAKIFSLRNALALRWRARRARHKVVFTNGCFDILHAGHVQYLEAARGLGDVLIVGLNDDLSVRRLKGEGRPVQNETDRATILAALEAVDAVVLFGEDTPAELIDTLRPDVLVKGADWAKDEIVGRETVEAAGGRVVRVSLRPGASTSAILRRLSAPRRKKK